MSALGNAGPSPPLRQGRRRRPIGSGTGSMQRPPASPSLPPDLLREVLARCDHETLVRCAASSRHLCRCMLDDPAFPRRRGEGFAPSLLLGFFHGSPDAGTRFVEAPAPAVVPRELIRSFLSHNEGFLRSFKEPVACHGGLVVLRQGRSTGELCVCDPMTGRRRFLPRPEAGRSIAILTGEEAGSSSPFQLLAVDQVCGWWRQKWVHYIRSQLFSSQEPFPAIMPGGAWGPIRRAESPDSTDGYIPQDIPVVVNRVAHWMSCSPSVRHQHDVFALDADTGHTELIKGPREIAHLRIQSIDVSLGSTADRRLCLVVADELMISMFTLSQEESRSWERRAAVAREGILAPPRWMGVDSFGGSSGTAVIRMNYEAAGRLVLNLETKEVVELPGEEEGGPSRQCFVYETDLPTLAAALLKFPSS
ncbi:hypothetical protein ACP70R_019890 [Stipagrostis hirtigluma subsp. patula]